MGTFDSNSSVLAVPLSLDLRRAPYSALHGRSPNSSAKEWISSKKLRRDGPLSPSNVGS